MEVGWRRRDGATVIERLFQSGSSKARCPRDPDRGCPDVALLNTAGGLTGGDRQDTLVRWAPDTCAGATTQAAERVYRSAGGKARVTTALDVGDRAFAEWLPQETILFESAALDRGLLLGLTGSGQALALETLVFGRTAMGERLARVDLSDRIEIRRDGQLQWLDVTRLATPADTVLLGGALGGGSLAVATLIYAAPDAPALLPALRTCLDGIAVPAAATALDGLVVMRFHHSDTASLRRSLVQVVGRVRATVAALPPRLPRLWHS
ncbi:MAG: urease accessory protein UreD [Pseudomonadota bacterium]